MQTKPLDVCAGLLESPDGVIESKIAVLEDAVKIAIDIKLCLGRCDYQLESRIR